jgi:2-(1,2-epoxy-1,2-dihydrophenyl)acetyl-CoA isomerase
MTNIEEHLMSEASPASVSYSVEGGVAAIRLERPGASNALDLATKNELLKALTSATADSTVRAVVFTAAGKNFCVGQDLAEHVDALRATPGHAMDTVHKHLRGGRPGFGAGQRHPHRGQ